jgi:hypothetical protein
MWNPISITLESLPDVDNQNKQDGYVLSWNQTQGNHQYVPMGGGQTTTEFSYGFTQGDTTVADLFIDGFEVLDLLTVNIALEQISINGSAFTALNIGTIVPPGANVVFKIAYSLGFNDGVLSIKGGSL